MKQKQLNNMNNLITSILGASTTLFMMDLIGKEMKNMFENEEKIPKGIIKEIMDGVIGGLLQHFEDQINDLKNEREEFEDEITNKREEIEKQKRYISDQQGVIDDLNNQIIKLRGKKSGRGSNK